MEKQQKVLNKITYDSGQTTPLGTKPNDECYTQMQDILNELVHWVPKFKDKNILCPCDWDIVDDEEEQSKIYSIRIEFDEDKIHGHTNTVKSVTYTLFDYLDNESGETKSVKLNSDEIDTFLADKLKCNFIRTFVENGKKWGIKSITASGYNPATGIGIKFQDIDYSDYDIVVTNPPFSMYGEFMDVLIANHIDFIVLAPFLNRSNPCLGLHLMKQEAYLGYNRQIHADFYNANAKNEYKRKTVCCDWITSFSDAQDEIDKTNHLVTGVNYEDYKEDYKFMENMTMKDGTHPIKINNTSAIPDNYYGWMFCSIGILDILSNHEFEWYLTNAAGYYNSHRDISPFAHKAFDEMVMAQSYIDFDGLPQKERRKLCKEKGEKGFHGVLIRRRQPCN